MIPNRQSPDQPDPNSDAPADAPASPLELRQRLLDLAHDVSSYLRHHHQRMVRAAAAVLLSASLAACNPFAMGSVPGLQQARPLQQEVRTGLPTSPGRYPIDPATLGRDAQGVYHFSWLQPGGTPGSGSGSPASVSLVKLAEGQSNELEVPARGDPILHLRSDTPVPLVGSAAQLTPTPGTSSSSTRHHSGGVMWFPFPVGGGSTYTSPSYRNPPETIQSDGTARGSSSSATAPSASSRMSGLPHAVSGQSGGTGSGTAASSRSGGLGGFLGGQSGGTGSGSAVSGKSGAGGSSGGVSGARSGGFSGGFGGGSSSSGG